MRARSAFTILETARPLLPAVAWLLTTLALLQLSGSSPAEGYESSIYAALPAEFWYLLLSSILLHVIVAAQSCLVDSREDTDWHAAISGIAGVALVSFVLLLMPYFRGYSSLRTDFGSHLSLGIEIAHEGNVAGGVIYPAAYALLQVVSVITGISVRDLWFMGGAVAHGLYILLFLLVARKVYADNRSVLFAGLVAAIPVAGAFLRTLSPANLSIQIFPLVVYLYLNSRSEKVWGFNLLLILTLVLLPFIHPLTALLGVFWLALLEIAAGSLAKNRPEESSRSIAPSLILAITWFLWLSSFAFLWNWGIEAVVNWLRGEAVTQFGVVRYLFGRSGMNLLESGILILKQESGIILYVGFALATLAANEFMIRRQDKHRGSLRYLRSIHLVLVFSIFTAAAALFGPFGELDLYRFSRYLVPWAVLSAASAPVLLGYFGSRGTKFGRLLIICTLLLVTAGGVSAIHPSEFTFLPNDQVTAQEVACMRWISEHGDGRATTGIWGVARLAIVALGHSTGNTMPGVHDPLPDHFGYDRAPFVASSLNQPAHILITEYDRQSVLDIWASSNKYSIGDFRALESDPSVVLIYANDQCEVWATQSWG